MRRRKALKLIATLAAAGAANPAVCGSSPHLKPASLSINPKPQFELSPFLFMQFMEPLGTTDGSVEAAWDHARDQWRPDVLNATRELAPTMLRWGGIFVDFYRWREGVGPHDHRPPMLNLCWGGLESNQVGTAEFVEFARQTGAEPLICVNFESDGRKNFAQSKGSVRTANAGEAADWVAYCNTAGNEERRRHGSEQPFRVHFWQIGNETSYDRNGFDLETSALKTVEFAKAMRQVDPTVQLIGWGDSGWASRMSEVAGEYLGYLAFHHMFNPDDGKRPVLAGELYRREVEATWNQLMNAWQTHEQKIRETRDSRGASKLPLALTECHYAIPGRNRCDVLSTWAAGVSYARLLNTHQRHGDVLKIATAADFCGTRWQTNAVMIPTPGGRSYLMPVARVMRLYRHHIGTHALKVEQVPSDLDVVASRRNQTLYLHVVNTNRTRSISTTIAINGARVSRGRVFEIADEPMIEISHLNSGTVMKTIEKPLSNDGSWDFPPASVSAIEAEFA